MPNYIDKDGNIIPLFFKGQKGDKGEKGDNGNIVQQEAIDNINSQLADITKQFPKDRKIPLTFNNDTGHFSTFSGDKACNNILTMNNDGSSGYLIPKTRLGVEVSTYNMPIGVLIGDSIIEGHPATHGRLDPLDLNKKNEKGQMAYYIENTTKIPIFNHGIGGQSYDQIRARWSRDVLSETTSLVPNKTLNKKPYFVILGTGINDIFKGRTLSQMQEDVLFFINSCKENGMSLIVLNCGTHSQNDDEKIRKIKEYNSWLDNEAKKYGHVKIFDFYSWSNDPLNDGYPRTGAFIDGVHPNKNTYMELSNEIIEKIFNDKSYNALIPRYIVVSNINNMLAPVNLTTNPSCVLLYINGIPNSFHKLSNGDFSSIELPKDILIETIGISFKLPQVLSSYTYIGIAEIFLSDVDLFNNTIKSYSNIKEFNAVNGISQYRSAKMQDTGITTFVTDANANNCIGVYVQDTANNKGSICTKGLTTCKTSNIPNEYGFIVTDTGGTFTCTNNPTGGVLAKVLEYNSEFSLALIDII